MQSKSKHVLISFTNKFIEMNKIHNNHSKLTYNAPEIVQIRLDNEISLALESTPPFPGNEGFSEVLEYNNINPFDQNSIKS